MSEPKRGEIWRVRLGRPNPSTELWGEHPCLVVSAEGYNEGGEYLTIVPLTSYDERREEVRSLWGVTITNQKDILLYRSNRDHLKIGEGIRIEDDEGNSYKSIIDCGQIRTIFRKRDDLNNQLCWDRRHGVLLTAPMIQVESALQTIISDDVRFNQGNRDALQYPTGSVLSMDARTLGTHRPRFLGLVVSSTGIDAVRERIFLWDRIIRKQRPLGQRTIVPLISTENFPNYDEESDVGVVKVRINPNTQGSKPYDVLALCKWIRTVDWSWQNTELIGFVSNEDLHSVHFWLRNYLKLSREE